MNFNLDTLVLTRGAHEENSGEFCAMEAVARIAGAKHSATPVCIVISYYVQILNDAWWSSAAARTNAFRPWLPRIAQLVGSPHDRTTEIARARWLAHRALTWWAPFTGMVATVSLEACGYNCARMRAAYLALHTNPCRGTAQEAENAANDAVNANANSAAARAAIYANATVDAYAAIDANNATDAAIAIASAAVLANANANAVYAVTDVEQDLYLRTAVEDLEGLLSIHANPVSRSETT